MPAKRRHPPTAPTTAAMRVVFPPDLLESFVESFPLLLLFLLFEFPLEPLLFPVAEVVPSINQTEPESNR
jgi:hypothetical protein